MVAPWETLPAPTAAAAPVPLAPLAAVSATAGARTSPLPDVLDALLPKELALGLPKPALVEVESRGVLVVADAPDACVVTPAPAAVGTDPTVGSDPAHAAVPPSR